MIAKLGPASSEYIHIRQQVLMLHTTRSILLRC